MVTIDQVESLLANYLNSAGFFVLLCIALVGVFVATQSYRILILIQTCVGALLFGYLGHLISSIFISEPIAEVSISGIICIACAVIGAFLFRKIFKLSLFISGAFVGWSVGGLLFNFLVPVLPGLALLESPFGIYIISGALALLLGLIFIFIFKLLYILSTSIVGGTVAGLCAAAIVMGVSELSIVIGLVAGFVFGVICCVIQFRKAKTIDA